MRKEESKQAHATYASCGLEPTRAESTQHGTVSCLFSSVSNPESMSHNHMLVGGLEDAPTSSSAQRVVDTAV